MILVVGSSNSSNSNRLKEVAESKGVKSYLVDDYHQVTELMLDNINTVGVTAGASAPEILVQQLINKLAKFGFLTVDEISHIKEDMHFSLPKQLRML